ncbi:MAG: branched-chain amino acid ABC transporter permease [Candidatus Woesearchaeota archaeon]|nr:branched-chain amino acid ABC transporter permease [Candidatus Woesearchaeota archaeon]
MAVWAQLIMNGLIAGSIYALMAAGFSLMFALQRFMNIAHGSSYVVAAFIAYTFAVILKFPMWISFLIGILAAAVLGILINLIIFQPLQKQKEKNNALLLSSFGVFLLVEAIILMVYGADVKSFGLPVKVGMDVLGAKVTPVQLVIICMAPVIFGLLALFLYKTKTGVALRATADNETIAKTMGINVRFMTYLTTGLGSALGGVAGILVALEQNLEHSMGMMAVLKGLTAAIIGGIGNVPAAILGGYLLGLAENIGVWYVPSGYKDAIGFGVFILFLLFRPQGFFGEKRREEASG